VGEEIPRRGHAVQQQRGQTYRVKRNTTIIFHGQLLGQVAAVTTPSGLSSTHHARQCTMIFPSKEISLHKERVSHTLFFLDMELVCSSNSSSKSGRSKMQGPSLPLGLVAVDTQATIWRPC